LEGWFLAVNGQFLENDSSRNTLRFHQGPPAINAVPNVLIGFDRGNRNGMAMGIIFKNDFLDGFGTWALGYIPYGGADFGEVQAVAQAVGDGDESAFYDAWVSAADRMSAEAEDALAKGHRTSARELFLRASTFYVCACHPLYGDPVDPRLLAAFRKQVAVLDKGLALSDPPALPLRIPFGDVSMPAYLIPAMGHEREVRPLLILTKELLSLIATLGVRV
jgi:hypothetical protein